MERHSGELGVRAAPLGSLNPFWSESETCSVASNSLWPHGLYSSWNSPSQNTGVGSLSLPQGIFPAQGLDSGLPHCRRILYQISHKGSPRILEWVAYPFSSRSSQLGNWTGVSCITGGFFTNWATREAQALLLCNSLLIWIGYFFLSKNAFHTVAILNLSSFLELLLNWM